MFGVFLTKKVEVMHVFLEYQHIDDSPKLLLCYEDLMNARYCPPSARTAVTYERCGE